MMASHARAGTLLHRLCEVVAGGPVTLVRVRQTFGLTWTEPMSACWSALLAGDEDDAYGSLTAVSIHARESLRRMRAFVQMLDLRWTLGVRSPFLLIPRAFTCRRMSERQFARSWKCAPVTKPAPLMNCGGSLFGSGAIATLASGSDYGRTCWRSRG